MEMLERAFLSKSSLPGSPEIGISSSARRIFEGITWTPDLEKITTSSTVALFCSTSFN
ncbi:hypothetical protein H1P_6410005 [Hyella patelloides LEGE 07179]|uniref:Uncharacterized protein n=1 Tax=Hyella patelloides LEGE 07179 TaxID=945734 RepID=A0A563W236_9CYAN|nr:hypothetical protein H1P_6410005 [Hyella patelloides LEGE 07179]